MTRPAAVDKDRATTAVKGVVDSRRLRYFVAVCDHGGFSRASSATGIAQPALTRQIKLLEQEIGLPLITRTGRGAVPTEEGQFLLTRSRAHLEGLDSIIQDLRLRYSRVAGAVSLGICPTIAPLFEAELTRFVEEHHPKVALSVTKAYSGDLKSLMDSGRLDVALTYRPDVPVPDRVISLLSEKLVLVSGAHDAGLPAPMALEDLAGIKLILPSGIHELRRIIDAVCAAVRLSLTPDLELDSLDAVKSVLTRRPFHYHTILPYNGVRADIEQGSLSFTEFSDPRMVRTISIVLGRGRNAEAIDMIAERIQTQAVDLLDHLDLVETGPSD